MTNKVYHKFLWFTGFLEGEHVSDMLARQKERLGVGWWCLPILTVLFIIGLLGFVFWLIWHIATFKLKKGGGI